MSGIEKSEDLFARARRVVPGGVNSPVRAFGAVGGTPRFMTGGQGPYITDVDGNRYVDLVCSWGPLILGHRHPAVVEAIEKALAAAPPTAPSRPARWSWPRRSSRGSLRSSACGW